MKSLHTRSCKTSDSTIKLAARVVQMRIFTRKIFLLIPDITLNVLIRHLILNAEFVQRFYVSSSLDPCLWTTLFAAYLLK